MAKIYRLSDRITVKIDDVIVKLAPLTLDQKTEIQIAMIKGYKSSDIREATRGLALAIQLSLKGIEGLEDSDGNPYKLQFQDNNTLTDECINDLMNLEMATKLALICAEMAKGVPSEFTDEKRNVFAGVEIVKTDS